jgi:hypothetical protein
MRLITDPHGNGNTMTKPLDEMNISELMQILTLRQRHSVLGYAKQFARNNMAASPPVAKMLQPKMGIKQGGTRAGGQQLRSASDRQIAIQTPAPSKATWFIDGRVRKTKDEVPSAAGGPLQPERTVKKPANPAKANKGKRRKGVRIGQFKIVNKLGFSKSSAAPSKSVRPVQGGLCSGR